LNRRALFTATLLCLSQSSISNGSKILAAPGPHSAPEAPQKASENTLKAKSAAVSSKPVISPIDVPRTPALILRRLEQIEASLMKPEARPTAEQKKALDGELTALTWAIEGSAAGTNPNLKLRALHSYAFYVRGVLHFEMKDMAGSMRFLDCALKDNPKNAKAYEQRGTNYVFSGQAKEGLSDFDSAIKNGLKSDFALINRGSMYVSTRQYDKAVEDLSLALEMSKVKGKPARFGEWMPLMLRARAYTGLKNYEAAKKDAQDMLSQGSAPQSVQKDMRTLIAALDAKANEKATPPADKPFKAERASIDTLIAPYVEEARKTLPIARERFSKGLPSKEWMSVTIRIYGPETDPGAVGAMEQVFVTVKSWDGQKIYGALASPVHLPNHTQGEPITVDEKDVLDWTIVRADGSEEGNIVGKFMESPEAKAALAGKNTEKNNEDLPAGAQSFPSAILPAQSVQTSPTNEPSLPLPSSSTLAPVIPTTAAPDSQPLQIPPQSPTQTPSQPPSQTPSQIPPN
jgi:tetratricopeptide (TPR) repeat protein/uncharacterized protein YegJ (DUF2314 family)